MSFPELDLLFHYTTAAAAVESILPTGQLRLGLFEFTNDPRESKQWYMSASVAEGVEFEDDTFEDLSNEADRLLRRSVKLACFTEDAPPHDDLNQVSGRGFGHSRLWSHLAGNHSGVCIGFDRNGLVGALRDQLAPLGTSFGASVQYVTDPSPPYGATHVDVEQVDEFGLDAVIARNVAKHWRELFFTKDVDWETEREYRWVLINQEPAPIFVEVSHCIRLIVLGESFALSRLPSIRHATRSMSDVQIAQIQYRTGRPQLLPLPETPKDLVRPHGKSGDLAARTAALMAAQDAAEESRLEGERLVANALAALQGALSRCAARFRELSDVDVQLHYSGFAAVPLRERQRAPGVARGDVLYSGGLMCVVEHQPRYSFTLVCAVAAQVLAGDLRRFHATFESERWLPSGNERQELWRGRRAVSGGPHATASAVELGAELEQQLESVIAAYNALRHPGGPD